MKSYKELEDQYVEVCHQLEDLFGCSYGGKLLDFLQELITFAEQANEVVEDAKVSGVYDAVMHQRDKQELESAKLEMKRLRTLSSVGIAVTYMQDIFRVEGETTAYYVNERANVRRQADSQLADQVRYFLGTFEIDKEHK